MTIKTFPTESGRSAASRNIGALRLLHDEGLIEFVESGEGVGRLRTSGIFTVRVRGQTLHLPAGDVPMFVQGALSQSKLVLTPDGKLRPFAPGAWNKTMHWYLDQIGKARKRLEMFNSCTTASDATCTICADPKTRLLPSKCHLKLSAVEQAEYDAAGFKGCEGCFRQAAILLASIGEAAAMVRQAHGHLSTAQQQEVAATPGLAEVLDAA